MPRSRPERLQPNSRPGRKPPGAAPTNLPRCWPTTSGCGCRQNFRLRQAAADLVPERRTLERRKPQVAAQPGAAGRDRWFSRAPTGVRRLRRAEGGRPLTVKIQLKNSDRRVLPRSVADGVCGLVFYSIQAWACDECAELSEKLYGATLSAL